MKMRTLGLALGLFCICAASGLARDEKKLFFLEFTHETPRELYLRTDPGHGEPEVFWYLLYTLHNKDTEDHPFYLQITADTDKGESYRDGYHPLALREIRKLQGNEGEVRLSGGETIEGHIERNGDRIDVDTETGFRSVKTGEIEEIRYKLWSHRDVTLPAKIASVRVSGERRPLGKPHKIDRPVIRAGERRKCVAIFRRLDAEMDRLTIRVLGLTNDILVEPIQPHTRKVTERIYRIVYERPGDEFFASLDKISHASEGWVDRVRIIKADLREPKEAK